MSLSSYWAALQKHGDLRNIIYDFAELYPHLRCLDYRRLRISYSATQSDHARYLPRRFCIDILQESINACSHIGVQSPVSL